MNHIVGESRCLRCSSGNVKFRYYNNRSFNEPRYWCNNCNKYYTHGGSIRKPPKIVGTRNSPAPSAAMEGAYEEGGGEAHVDVDAVKHENSNESKVSIKSTEGEANGAPERPGVKHAHISAHEPKLMLTLGALRTQRRRGAPVKSLPQ